MRAYNVNENDGRCKFHQHFTRAFSANAFVPKYFKAKM